MNDPRDPTSNAPASPAPTEAAPSAVERVASRNVPHVGLRTIWRRRARQWFAAERMREMGTTLALVAPLTILIWVWAEREQTRPIRKQFFVELRSSDPSKTLAVENANDARATIDVALTGPSSGIDQLTELISKDRSRAYLTLDVDEPREVGGPYEVAVAPLLNKQKLFSDLGLSVNDEATTPERLQVIIDRQVERDVPIQLPADLSGVVASARIEPASVRVRGPERVITRLESAGGLRAELDLTGDDRVASARPGETVELGTLKLKPIADDAVKFDASTVERVSVQVSAEQQGEIPLMAVYLAQPAALNVRVRIDPPTLTRVKVVGRADVLKRLADATTDVRPYAELTFTPDDVGKSGRRLPTFRNLPPGVRVVDGSVAEINFEVSESGS